MFRFRKIISHKSEATSCPSLTSECVITLSQDPRAINIGECFGIPLDLKSSFECCTPNGYFDSVLSECVRTMKEGECSHFDVTFSAVDSGKPESFGIEIRLHSFSEGKDFHNMTVEERVNIAEIWKKFGNSHFSKSNSCMAGYWYSKALFSLLSCHKDDFGAHDKANYNHLLCCCRVNLSAVQLRRKLYNHVITNCSKALAIDSNLAKALFRRAQAQIALDNKSSAVKDLKTALKVEPNSGAVRKLLRELLGDN